ncbi:hypothetical protein FOMPIDRAFT_1023112 [Fomitopsis schrenkii]|uniref:Uncharacterized protein n=1 Tax=Fomitopsis schrenkii TaxID=2126942 RepID=S8FKG5_FOMSC|nr:hypothetical protein FOMPIDRAFT_1023112 [Fomitopsis schrenkii]
MQWGILLAVALPVPMLSLSMACPHTCSLCSSAAILRPLSSRGMALTESPRLMSAPPYLQV